MNEEQIKARLSKSKMLQSLFPILISMERLSPFIAIMAESELGRCWQPNWLVKEWTVIRQLNVLRN